tara:strand:+ start:3549 stop:3779 length:231 start_codon:yes stop_codon:yes gene_type:complete
MLNAQWQKWRQRYYRSINMHEMQLVLPPEVIHLIKQEADGLGITYSKHLLATLDAQATHKLKELNHEKFTYERATT